MKLMRRLFTWIAMLTILATAAPLCAGDTMIFNYFDNYMPYSWKENKQMRGILIDIADEAVRKRMGIEVIHKGYPWKRAQKMVKKGKADALITLCGTRGDWTQSGNEVVLTLEIKIFVKAGNPKIHQLEGVKKLDDLKPFRLIDYAGNSWCQKKLIDRNFKVDLAPNKNAIFPMLIKERGDANLCNSMTGRYFIKKAG